MEDLKTFYIVIATIYLIILGIMWNSSNVLNMLIKFWQLGTAFIGIQLLLMKYLNYTGDYDIVAKLSRAQFTDYKFIISSGIISILLALIWKSSGVHWNLVIKLISTLIGMLAATLFYIG